MMGPAGFVLAILGCGEAEAPCHQVMLSEARYESQAACLAATDEQAARHTDLPFPVVVAECRPAIRPASLRAHEVRRPGPRGTLPRTRIASAGR